MGNPGSGKSTLSNLQAIRLMGGKRGSYFTSGYSAGGQGVTSLSLRKPFPESSPNVFILDTPGLYDSNKRDECAKEIEAALKSDDNGDFKIMVMTPLFSSITKEHPFSMWGFVQPLLISRYRSLWSPLKLGVSG